MSQYLGQHFLKSEKAINKIIAALNIESGDKLVVEIGPGKGALTLPMAKSFKNLNSDLKIIAIEKDEKLADELILKIKELGLDNTEVIKGDILKILPELVLKLEIKNYKLIGNIPYYITGKILRTISELENKPGISVLMVQKEVAERISAVPPHNNLLASATAIWANIKIVFKLKASEFDPPPEVDSAVIQLESKDINISEKELGAFYELIHKVFKQPRKTLTNNLKEGLGLPRIEIEKLINSIGLPLNSRPQDVSIEQILKIQEQFSNFLKK